jgi:hypothetical protein
VSDLLLRFFIGGAIVSLFALVGDLFTPKSFGGLFGAAPSVALATLGLTLLKEGRAYTALECRSMIIGAIALFFYAVLVSWLLMRRRIPALRATLFAMPLWFIVALGGWELLR